MMYEPFSKGDNLTIKKWLVVQYEYVELLLMPPELRRAIIISTVLEVRRALINSPWSKTLFVFFKILFFNREERSKV